MNENRPTSGGTSAFMLVIGGLLCLAPLAWGGVATDGTLGGAATALTGPDYLIDSSLGVQSGGNLFHSFAAFSVRTGESATFTHSGASAIANVISRVTGGKPSHIDGYLGSEIAGADFFFMNPAGVFFGPDAMIDLPAAFHVSTGPYLGFANGERFHAAPSGGGVLSADAPAAFGFLGEAVGDITLEGSYVDFPGHTQVTLAGGDITIRDAAISTAGSNAVLAAVGNGAGEIPIQRDFDPSGSFPFDANGSLEILGSALDWSLGWLEESTGGQMIVRAGDATLTDSEIFNDNMVLGGIASGGVDWQSDTLTLNDSSFAAENMGSGPGSLLGFRVNGRFQATGSFITTDALDEGDAGLIAIHGDSVDISDSYFSSGTFESGDAGDIQLEGRSEVMIHDLAWISSDTRASGDAGNISINGPRIRISDLSYVSSDTWGSGNSGSIRLDASQRITVSNGGWVSSDSLAEGNAGNISMRASQVQIEQDSYISSDAYASGNAGNIRLQGSSGVSIHSGSWVSSDALAVTSPAGNAGSISLLGGDIGISGASRVSSTTEGPGRAGDISLNGQHVRMQGSVVTSETTGGGSAGTVNVTGQFLSMDAATLSSDSTPAGGSGGGNAGEIDVTIADTITLGNNSRITSSTSGSGASGILRILGERRIELDDSAITTNTSGSGNAGDIFVTTDQLAMSNALITSDALSGGASAGDAGVVTINARDSLTLTDDARISSETRGPGDAGKVAIDVERLRLTDSRITSDTSASGVAGGVSIRAVELVLEADGVISSDSRGPGDAGDVEIFTASLLIDGANGAWTGISSKAEGAGDGGRVLVEVSGEALLRNRGLISSDAHAQGSAGNVRVSAADLTLLGGGISSSTLDTRRSDAGAAGSVAVAVINDLHMDNAGHITSQTQGSGSAGSVVVEVGGGIRLFNRSRIATSAADQSSGDAGTVKVASAHLTIDGGGEITGIFSGVGEQSSGNAGAVEVAVQEQTRISDAGQIATSTGAHASGDAGSVAVASANLTIDGGGEITGIFSGVGEQSSGNAGAVEVTVREQTRISDAGQIATSTGGGSAGNAGEVRVSSGDLAIDGMGSPAPATGTLSEVGDGSSGSAGEVFLDISGELALVDGGRIATGAGRDSSGDAGRIEVRTVTLRIDAHDDANTPTGLFSRVEAGATGEVGDIRITARETALSRGGEISIASLSEATAQQQGANHLIALTGETLTLDRRSLITSESLGPAGAGNIEITMTDSIELNRAGISSEGRQGRAGALLLNADRITLANDSNLSSSIYGAGDAGVIALRARNFSMSDSGIASDTHGDGDGGSVAIDAVTLTFTDAARITAESHASGAGGEIALVGEEIQLLGDSRISSNAYASGDAGNISLDAAGTLRQIDSRITSDTSASGDAGSLSLRIGEGIELDAALITSSSTANAADAGAAGDITITNAHGDILLRNDTSIATRAESAGGGRIQIAAEDGWIWGWDSQITTSVREGFGDGGNIDIDSDYAIFQGSAIIAKAYQGNGGGIHILSDYFIRDTYSILDASSRFGYDGVIEIDSPAADANANLITFTADFLDAEQWAQTPCAARVGSRGSRLIIDQGGTIPADAPDDLLPSPLPLPPLEIDQGAGSAPHKLGGLAPTFTLTQDCERLP